MPPMPPPLPSIMPLIIGPMVCIIMAKRRLPIFAFIISSIGAIWVIMSSPPPPPPKPANWAFAGIVVSVNSSTAWPPGTPPCQLRSWQNSSCAARLRKRRSRAHGARLGAGGGPSVRKITQGRDKGWAAKWPSAPSDRATSGGLARKAFCIAATPDPSGRPYRARPRAAARRRSRPSRLRPSPSANTCAEALCCVSRSLLMA